MPSNQPVKRTLEEELKDPKSQLSIDINNALMNRNALLRELRIEEIEYADYLAAKEKEEDAENERAEQRRAQQEAMLRQSLTEYYAEQHKLAEQALALGLKPLNTYDVLLTSIADFQFQLNVIAAQLANTHAQIQQAQASHAAVAAGWVNKHVAYVNSYFDVVYQTPEMDLNGAYGRHLSPAQRLEFELNRQEARERAAALSSPIEVFARLPEEHPARQQPPENLERLAFARHALLSEVLGFTPVKREIDTWLASQGEAERNAFQREYGGAIRFSKTLVRRASRHPAVQQQQDEMLEMQHAMALLQNMLRELEKSARQLEEMQQTKTRGLRQAYSDAGDLVAQQGYPQQAVRLYELRDGTYSELVAERSPHAFRAGRGG
ncbi:MAG: hypothetical protein K0Q74_1625 [Gammaproteobacteria bacterium]|jgi:hypothetical protein|nr:hypothetical protein [Gammaproteobacteria bacterium]